MKKFASLVIVLSIILSMFSFSETSASGKVIYETSFEEGIEDWTYRSAGSQYLCRFSTSCSTSGAASLYIHDNSVESAMGMDSPYIEVEPQTTYYVAVNCHVIEEGVNLFVRLYDENKNQLPSPDSVGAKVGNWKNVSIKVTTPENAKYIQASISSVSSTMGKGYFDDFKVVKGEYEAPSEIKGTYPEQEEIIIEKPDIDGVEEGTVLFYDSFDEEIIDKKKWDYFNSAITTNFITPVTGVYRTGTGSVHVIDENDSKALGIKSKMIPVSAGNLYTASMYVKHIENAPIRLYVRFYKSNGTTMLYNKAAPIASSLNWELTYMYVLAPEDAAYCQVLAVTNSGSYGEGYFDDVCVVKGILKPEQPEKKFVAPKQADPQDAQIIKPVNNKLEYATYNDMGDKLADYSYAGFYGGDYELPVTANFPVVETLSPSGSWDDHLAIQKAIDKAERKDGGMNVVKLKAGRYYLGDTIKLKSGVILSGEGQGPYGTVLYDYLPYQNTPVVISGSAPTTTGKRAYIIDEYVKAGTKTIRISDEDVKNFKVGDLITINYASTTEWSSAIGMLGVINVYDNDTSWTEGKISVYTERQIEKIEGNEITLDFALFAPVATNLLPTYISKLRDSGRIQNVGIENLRLESYFNGDKNDESHATTAIKITNAKNIFLRDLTSKYFYMGIVSSSSRAKQVTVLNCSCLDPVSTVTGSRRYSFLAGAGAQQILTTGSYSYDARHDFATSREVTGPISYVDNVVDSSNTSNETHGTWSTGVLYDNIYEIGHNSKGFIAMANRGIYGTVTSQGWTAASSVAWNCLATTIIVHKPPLSYQNFSVGMWGLYQDQEAQDKKDGNITSYKKIYRTGESTTYTEANFATDAGTSFVGDAYRESDYAPVNPRSLFKAQLSERYTGVITNAKPNAPIITYPNCDGLLSSSIVKVTGVAQKGATKVHVYIDNECIKVNPSRDGTFVAAKILSDGNHKIYATQVIDGVEGCKTADRFITLNVSDGNPEYLQSIYPPEVTTMLVNDPRPTYDEYVNSMKITDVDYEKTEEGYTVDVTVDKGTKALGTVKIVAALYGAFDKFITYVYKDYDETEATNSVDIKTTEDVKSIKVMLWESMEKLNPLARMVKKIIE